MTTEQSPFLLWWLTLNIIKYVDGDGGEAQHPRLLQAGEHQGRAVTNDKPVAVHVYCVGHVLTVVFKED